MELDFSIFTLNLWGIPAGIAKNVSERISAICDLLLIKDYDCVCLQEVWTKSQYEGIKQNLINVLPYSHYFFSGAFGSGICIFSKYPIEDVFFHQWKLNGYFHKINHADWFGGKGIGVCKIIINNYVINVYTAHLHAEYNPDNDEYKVHRLLQAFDTAQLIRFTSKKADLVVLAGDLNTEPNSLAYEMMCTLPGLVDAYKTAHPGCNEDNIGQTCETLTNSYTSQKNIKAQNPGQRIDYILYHEGTELKVKLKKCLLPLPPCVPDKSFSYSDHEALTATLQISAEKASITPEDINAKCMVLQKALEVLNRGLQNLRRHRKYYLLFTVFSFISIIGLFLVIVPSPYNILFYILICLFGFCGLYTFFMGTLWNWIERNAVLDGIYSIEILLENLRKKIDTYT